MAQTSAGVAPHQLLLPTGLDLPDPDCAVFAARHQGSATRPEAHAPHRTGWLQRPEVLRRQGPAAVALPDTHDPVLAAGGQPVSVGAEAEGEHRAVDRVDRLFRAGVRITNANGAVLTSGSESMTVGAEADGSDQPLVAVERAFQAIRRHRMDLDGVFAGQRQASGVRAEAEGQDLRAPGFEGDGALPRPQHRIQGHPARGGVLRSGQPPAVAADAGQAARGGRIAQGAERASRPVPDMNDTVARAGRQELAVAAEGDAHHFADRFRQLADGILQDEGVALRGQRAQPDLLVGAGQGQRLAVRTEAHLATQPLFGVSALGDASATGDVHEPDRAAGVEDGQRAVRGAETDLNDPGFVMEEAAGLAGLIGREVVQVHVLVFTAGDKGLAIRAETDAANRFGVAGQGAQQLARGGVPELDRLVSAGGSDSPAVRTDAHVPDLVAVAVQDGGGAVLAIPEADGAVAAGRDQKAVVGAAADGRDGVLVAPVANRLAGGRVPALHRRVVGAGDDLAVRREAETADRAGLVHACLALSGTVGVQVAVFPAAQLGRAGGQHLAGADEVAGLQFVLGQADGQGVVVGLGAQQGLVGGLLGLAGDRLGLTGPIALGANAVALGLQAPGERPTQGEQNDQGQQADADQGCRRRTAAGPFDEPFRQTSRAGQDGFAAQEPGQVVGQDGGAGVAFVRLLVQAGEADRFQVGGHAGVEAARRHRLGADHLQDRVQRCGRPEGRPTGEALVEDGAQGVHVRGGAQVGVAAVGLFGGHVRGRAQDGALLRPSRLAVEALGQAEVGDLGPEDRGRKSEVRGQRTEVRGSSTVLANL